MCEGYVDSAHAPQVYSFLGNTWVLPFFNAPTIKTKAVMNNDPS